MQVVENDAESATIYVSQKELLMMYSRVQEGRIAFECDSPTGEGIERVLQQAAVLIGIAQNEETQH